MVGLFDLVGTHPDFQGNGLGKAMMAEGRRRMQAASMRRAVLGFDPNNVAAVALYTSPTECAPSFLFFVRPKTEPPGMTEIYQGGSVFGRLQ